jgi:DNA anti-recombination protein RmuC
MGDLTKLNKEDSEHILDIVGELGTCTTEQVREEMAERHGLEAPIEQVQRYMEFLRSGFPRKLAHAGPGRWNLVDLG